MSDGLSPVISIEASMKRAVEACDILSLAEFIVGIEYILQDSYTHAE
jgi:hypothetical protein